MRNILNHRFFGQAFQQHSVIGVQVAENDCYLLFAMHNAPIVDSLLNKKPFVIRVYYGTSVVLTYSVACSLCIFGCVMSKAYTSFSRTHSSFRKCLCQHSICTSPKLKLTPFVSSYYDLAYFIASVFVRPTTFQVIKLYSIIS